MKISIDDDLYERIKAVHKGNTDAAIQRALTVLPIQDKGRTLVLDAPQLHRLETLLAGGSLTSGGDLIRKVEALASFEVGKVTVPLDATDWDRLAQRATRLGLSVARYVELMHERFREEWMTIGEPSVAYAEAEALRLARERELAAAK